MARRRKGERVLGPYEHKRGGRHVGYRVISVDAEGRKTPDYFKEKAEAEAFAKELRMKLSDISTVGGALDRYDQYLSQEKENLRKSVDTTISRLGAFFNDDQLPLWALTIENFAAIYDRRTKAMIRKGKNTTPVKITTDTHRNELAEAKTFLRWAAQQGVVSQAVVRRLQEVKGKGKRRRGKKQHRVDDARKWYAKALAQAKKHDGAVAALCTFVFNMRCTEVVTARVANVDDDGRLIHVWDSKTEAGTRPLLVPEEMRPFLLRLCKDKLPSAWLFSSSRSASGRPTRDWPRKWVKRICQAAGVPEITAHGMRGLHSTLANRAGVTPQVIAECMGHNNPRVTRDHYIDSGVAAQADQQRMLERLENKGEAESQRARCANTEPSNK